MTLEEYHAKVQEHDAEEDEILTSLEEGELEDSQANPRLKALEAKRSALETEFDAGPPDDELGEEEEETQPEEETTETEPTEEAQPEATQQRDDQGRFVGVPFQQKPEDKKRDDLAARFPSMV